MRADFKASFCTTIGLLLPISLTVACAREPLAGEPRLGEQQGEVGTFLAVGADIETDGAQPFAQILLDEVSLPAAKSKGSGKSSSKEPFDFVLLKTETKGLTIGTVFDGPSSVSKNDTGVFIPASITKVVTSALALKTLGYDFKFKTKVLWSDEEGSDVAKDLTIIADGDPTTGRGNEAKGFGRARLAEIVKTLKAKGVKKVAGSLRLVPMDERKDLAIPTPGIDAEDNLACYGALAQNFNFRWNCAGLAITGFEKANWSDPDLEFPIRFDMTKGATNSLATKPVFDSIGRIEAFLVQGVWGTKKPRIDGASAPISNAKEWFGNALISELKKQGVDIKGVVPSMPSGLDARALLATRGVQSFELESEPLHEILRHMNKPSDNFLADALFKAVAERHSSKAADLRVAGAQAIRDGVEEWMKRHGHPEYADEIYLLDGSGLSRNNHATPRAYLALLKEFAKEPTFVQLWDSLPIAGRDGTLQGRMGGTRAEGMVRAKTGTVREAYQLAGYVPKLGADGRALEYVPFVILSSANPKNKGRVRAFQDQLVVKLMDVVNPPKKKAP